MTLAEIAALEAMLRDNPDDAAGYLCNAGDGLLAAARAYLDLKSALVHMANLDMPGITEAEFLAQVFEEAKSLGWPGLQSEGGKEQALPGDFDNDHDQMLNDGDPGEP